MARKPTPQGFSEGAQQKLSGAPDMLRPIPKRERVKLGEGGRFVIPAAMRAEMGVEIGEALVMHVENGELRVRGQREIKRRIQEQAKKFSKPGVSVVDELIAERRAEAAKELAEENAWRKARGLPPLKA
jgi:bifunctional DNA-binding transcriptional regulator/antitoxin component of YhaV-PrlF toxin-antitoxin module